MNTEQSSHRRDPEGGLSQGKKLKNMKKGMGTQTGPHTQAQRGGLGEQETRHNEGRGQRRPAKLREAERGLLSKGPRVWAFPQPGGPEWWRSEGLPTAGLRGCSPR